MPKRDSAGRWMPRGYGKKAKSSPRSYSYGNWRKASYYRGYYKKYSQKINSKKWSVAPQKLPTVATSAGYNKYTTVRTFNNTFFEPLNQEFDVTGTYGANTVVTARNSSWALYPKLTEFAGFKSMMVTHEMAKPISFTVKARIVKMGQLMQSGSSSVVARNNNVIDYSANPSGNVNGGSIMSPGVYEYMEVRTCVDYDGKYGTGGSDKYQITDMIDAGNSALGWINGRYLKTIAQFAPRQYVSAPNSTGQAAAPVMNDTQYFPCHMFYQYNASTGKWDTNAATPKFGGLNCFATSYDAVGAGFDGTTVDNNPVLYVQYYVEAKVAFKGKVKNKEVLSIDDTLIDITT